MDLKKKILIFIPQDLFVRNYISTNCFKLLQSNYKVRLLVSDSIVNKKDIESCGIPFEYYSEASPRNKLLYYILDLLMWRYRKRSSTFKFRLYRYQGLKLEFPIETKLVKKIFLITWRIIRFIYLRIRNYILGSSPIFYPYYYLLKFYLGLNMFLENKILTLKPDLILFPSSAYDPIGIDLIDICKKNKIKSFFLIDNWDNLSSKSIFFNRPDFIGVWGQQSKEHAKTVQSFQSQQVKLLGTPRFDQYFHLRDKKLESPYKFPYFLFVGTALKFDELACISKLDSIIQHNPQLQHYKIIYRPHPWRHSLEILDLSSLNNVIIDTQIESAYALGKNSTSLQPALDYYPALLSNATLAMGGLTSMLIEATIFYKPFIGMIHDDYKNFTSMHNVYKSYIHFKGISEIDSISLCDNLETLESSITKMLNTKKFMNNDQIDSQRNFFYFHDNLSYPQRLKNACNEILDF
jgi:hypothetical protein